MGVQATGLAFLHHDGDEVFLIRLGGFNGSALPFQTLCDLGGDVGELALEIGAGAGRGGVKAVHCERAVLVAGVGQFLDAVAAANVGAKVEQRGIRLVADVPVRCAAVVGNLNRNSPVVVPRTGRTPRAVSFVAKQGLPQKADAAAAFDGVVCAHLARGFTDKSAESLKRCVASHVMNGNLADGLAPGPVAVWADGRVNGQCRITHSRPLPSRSTVPRPFRATESFHHSSVSLSFLFHRRHRPLHRVGEARLLGHIPQRLPVGLPVGLHRLKVS